MPARTKSLFSRPLDLLYFVFFLTHIPIMFVVDLTPLYPTTIHKTFPVLSQIRQWYISTYRDRFFSGPPAWFMLYIWLEALLHVPLSVWAVGALVRDDPLLPLPLAIFATQVAVTTATCIVEYFTWDDFSNAERWALGQLYVPYLGLAIFMLADMYSRLAKQIRQGEGLGMERKKR